MDLPKQMFYGSEQLLEQVWSNILDNAIKHSPQDSTIHVSISWTENRLFVRISDHGDGMDEEVQKHILRNFIKVTVPEKPREMVWVSHSLSGSLICAGAKSWFKAHLAKARPFRLPCRCSVCTNLTRCFYQSGKFSLKLQKKQCRHQKGASTVVLLHSQCACFSAEKRCRLWNVWGIYQLALFQYSAKGFPRTQEIAPANHSIPH